MSENDTLGFGGFPPPSGPPQKPPKRHRFRNWVVIPAASLIGVSIVIAALGGGSKPSAGTVAPLPSGLSSGIVTFTASPDPAQFTDPAGLACPVSQTYNGGDGNFYCPGDSPSPSAPAPTTPADTAPAVSASRQQALDSAQSYLSDGQGFSRAGLIQQLTSSYGEGFSKADATWAVDHSGADWDAQAVISAKNYLASGEGFSRQGLIQQLTSSYGEGFTYAQAVYAVGKVGL